MQVAFKDNSPYIERRLGKKHGFSENYVFNAANKHTVEMADADVQVLREQHPETAAQFAFADGQKAGAK